MSMSNRPPPARCFSTPSWKLKKQYPVMPRSERKQISSHVTHKIKTPPTDSPYGRAKYVQLVDKDPNRAISMFWAAINLGDRLDSSLKDMALVMKQLNRSDEAIEAIKSFRHLCSVESQESLDNILLELYKGSGRIEEQIEMLQAKLKQIEERVSFSGRSLKPARSNGKRIQITIEQEYSRMLGNLAWAYLQQDKYKSAEEFYRKALSIDQDKNKQCNLAICLMYMDRMVEAKFVLECARSSGERLMEEAHAKSFERASQILVELESQSCEENKRPFSSLMNVFGSKWNENQERVAGAEISYDTFSMNPAGGSPVLFTQPRRGSSYSCGNAASGCNRKLSFAVYGKQERNSGTERTSCDEEYATESGNHKELQSECKPIKENLKVRKSFDSSNKGNWANMVVADKVKFQGTKYFDESTKCNILFGSLSAQNQTEPWQKTGVLGFER